MQALTKIADDLYRIVDQLDDYTSPMEGHPLSTVSEKLDMASTEIHTAIKRIRRASMEEATS